MAMELKAQKRKLGSRSILTELRGKGQIPAVLYGDGKESEPIAVEEREFIQIANRQGLHHVIKLNVDGISYNVMVKDVQSDPIKNKVLHLDFNKINMNEKIDTTVVVVLEGEAEGAKNGGVLQHMLRELTISCLPSEIPDKITFNVEHLQIGDSVTVSDLTVPDGIEVKHEGDEVVLSIVPSQAQPTDIAAEEAEADAGAADRTDAENSSGDTASDRG
ncbi:50S ribosomal protein L25/general stress protein Ctc [Aneurinibacillus thermoaerophilus]|uniref:Large ribosomal subunit protein bL25 n=1 Tax=Aneurinibacillus thermoaerophilus TaxID=143495 RepID=A0ABX8YB71_ANETH|nr:50S ribosomal protein L25/general stress protein Ctc [Aneurinibacillus thermoaerophilus]QYY42899.1 50S ribosomal protein L25/general stress protein Ctc [Aneurinibacillus thermoaerophilus]